MDSVKTSPRLSDELARLAENCRNSSLTYGGLAGGLTLRGHALISLFLSLIFLVPIPLPGVSIVFGLIIMLAGIRMLLGLPPWLPKVWMDRPVPHASFLKIFETAERWLKKLKWLVKPRSLYLIHNWWANRLNGVFLFLGGLLLALPLPPGTNAPPALGIVLLSIGVLEQDGLFVLLGHLVILAVTAVFSIATIFGTGILIRMVTSLI